HVGRAVIVVAVGDELSERPDVSEAAGRELERAALSLARRGGGGGELSGLMPRDRDHPVAGRCERRTDHEAEPTARAGDDDITHPVAPACRRPTPRAPARCGWRPAPCRAR